MTPTSSAQFGSSTWSPDSSLKGGVGVPTDRSVKKGVSFQMEDSDMLDSSVARDLFRGASTVKVSNP